MIQTNNHDLQMPAPISQYLVMTLNQRGPVSMYLDEYAQQFIHFSAAQTSPVLELGTAYGFVTIAALNEGATVIANDIEPKHLQILYHRTPEHCRNRLTLLPGKFPDVLSLQSDSIGACYVSRMLGYLEPSTLRLGFEKIFACLKSNAKFFILASPPYKALFKNIIPLYEQRVRDNIEWPGYFTELKTLVGGKYGSYAPDKLHFLDEKILTRELKNAGFIVEKAELYERKELPDSARVDGREGVVAIARKP